jgi:hypothetical protein
MMRDKELGETVPNPGRMSRFRMFRELAKHAIRSGTTYEAWRMERASEAEFAQYALDPTLFDSKISPFSTEDEQLRIHSSQAYTFAQAWRARRLEQFGVKWKPQTPADQLFVAFRDVTAARVLQPQEINVVAAINEATLAVQGPAAAYGSDAPIRGEIESQEAMVRARTQLFGEISRYMQPEAT